MFKHNYICKIALCFSILAFCFLDGNARSQQIDNKQTEKVDLGRDNPFAQLSKEKKQSVLQPIFEAIDTEDSTPELFVQTVMLKFLDAKSLKQAIENMSSKYGNIAINEKNNSLIVCDTKEYLTRILSEIRRADITPQQIMIEVVILDVQLNDDTEIGINWDILSEERDDISYRQNFTTRLGSTPENETSIGDASAFNTTGLGGSFSVILGNVRNVVYLLQQKRKVEILASPRVMMVSGESATIEAVEELPYREVVDTAAGGANAITYTQFKRVGVQLNVGATLTDNNDIFLTVDAEQNVATGESDTDVPIVDTRKANTSLLLKDGQVVIFGGLRRQEKTKKINKIPFIADLPIVGELFKSTKIVINNSELIIFLSPHVYKGEPISDDAMAKYKEIKNMKILPIPDDGNEKDRLEYGSQ